MTRLVLLRVLVRLLLALVGFVGHDLPRQKGDALPLQLDLEGRRLPK